MTTESTPILFSSAENYLELSRAARRGDIQRLAVGVYSSDSTTAPEVLVRRHWRTIVGGAFPEAVITDRSAPAGGPVDGVLYLAHNARGRSLSLPGLTVTARRGSAALVGDILIPGGLHQASLARALCENAQSTWAKEGSIPRRLRHNELGDWVDRIAQFAADGGLHDLRSEIHNLAPQLGLSTSSVGRLDRLIGAALGTRPAPRGSRALTLRSMGLPYDSARIEQLTILFDALRASAPQNLPAESLAGGLLPFYEAYFSNYIEGTEFTVDEAESVVFDGADPGGRHFDAEDVRGTYAVVSDFEGMRQTAKTPTQFVSLLTSRHAVVMAARPEKNPGAFKERPNRAGETLFVHPALVRGTLIEGWERLGELDTAWERAVYVHYLVAIVHPFDDGNGRVARIMMNSELDRAGQTRIIIPTVFRDDYIGALRRLDRGNDPTVLVKSLRLAHAWTASIDFHDHDDVRRQLSATHAFETEHSSRRLVLRAETTSPTGSEPSLPWSRNLGLNAPSESPHVSNESGIGL